MSKSDKQSKTDAEKIEVGEWSEVRPLRRRFPGPAGAESALRVAVDRAAYAELIAHAKESLDAEICGVLAGHLCEDDEGEFVHVEAAIRGAAAREASARVTFTQETWNEVHKTLERDHPKLRMVGWYHSHPGFGVEFSEMDVFIQKNFFPAPTQIALVTDPLGGDLAICRNTDAGIDYLHRFWVDGREHACVTPRPQGGGARDVAPGDAQAIETRLAQIMRELDELRRGLNRMLTALLLVACTGIVAWIGVTVYNGYFARTEPPHLRSYAPVPVQIGDKTVMLGVGVVDWSIPPELNAVLLEMQKGAKGDAKPATPAPSATPPAEKPAPAVEAPPPTPLP